MRRLIIGLALALLALCFFKGAPKSETASVEEVIADLNRTVDKRLADRLYSLRLGAELSAAILEPD